MQKKHICGVEATQSTLLFVASKLCGQTISCGIKTAQTRDIFGIESKHVRQQYFVRSQSLAGKVFVESKLCRQTCVFVETQLCRHKCSYCSIKIVQTFFCGGKTVQTFYVWQELDSPLPVEHYMMESLQDKVQEINPRYRIGILFQGDHPGDLEDEDG